MLPLGAAIGLIWFLLCLIPAWQLAVFGMAGFLIFTVGYENAQFLKRKDYCKKNNLYSSGINWPDSIIDVIAMRAIWCMLLADILMAKPSKNFDSSEFACKCGCGYDTPDPELIRMLQVARYVRRSNTTLVRMLMRN